MNTFEQDVYSCRPSWDDGGKPDLHIDTLGIFKSAGDFIWEQTCQNIVPHVVREGRGEMEVDGKVYEVKAGDIFVFWPGERLRYHDFPESPWRYTWLRLAGERARWALAQAGLSPRTPWRNLSGETRFWDCLRQMEKRMKDGRYPPLYPVAAAWELIAALQPESGDGRGQADIAVACRQVIDGHLLRPPSVEKLARQFRLTRSSLFRVFKRHFGMSPKEYIEQRRFAKAAEMLRESRLSVKEVAHACGFENQQYFCRAFKQRYCLPPSAWRDENPPDPEKS